MKIKIKMIMLTLKFVAVTAVVLAGTLAEAGNIDLATVPNRDTVQLTIYNGADLTLVRETRKIVFKKGGNPLQFSWANTLIDPTSVQLRFLNHAEKLDVLDTTFPHDRPQELVWNVGSEWAGEATVEISYFTSGISWSADYTIIAQADESAAQIEGYVTVVNQSGEDYEQAQVRLVVGTINLVEQIAQLARQSGIDTDKLGFDDQRYNRLRSDSAREMVLRAEEMSFSDSVMPASAPARQKDIVKEGLSEYFIFTIEGTETVNNGSRKRLPSFAAEAPLDVEYRYRPQEYGHQLVRMFLMTNDEDAGLGVSPLPDGQVRVFRQQAGKDGAGRGLTFVARQQVKYIPIGEKIEINLGVDPDVGFEAVVQRVYRDNIWLQLRTPQVIRKVGEPGVAFDDRSRVVGWDDHQVVARRVRNDTPRPIKIEVRESFWGDATFISQLEAERFDNQTVRYRGELGPGEEVQAVYEVIQRQGRNVNQQRVEIVEGAVSLRDWQRE